MKRLSASFLVLALATGFTVRSNGAEEPELKSLKSDPFCVVQIEDEVKVIKKSELLGLRKELDGKYREALKEYNASRVAARKSREAFTALRPSKPVLKTIAASVKNEEEANTLRDKVLSEYVVVKVGDALRVVRQIELVSFRTKLESDYHQAMTKYAEARKEARKSKRTFTESPPTRPRIRVVASRLNSEDAALARMRHLEGKDRKATDRKTADRRTKAKTKTKKKGKENEDEEGIEKDEEPDDDPNL